MHSSKCGCKNLLTYVGLWTTTGATHFEAGQLDGLEMGQMALNQASWRMGISIPMYLVCKVQIQAICGLSYANLAFELCADNLWIGHLLTHTLLDVSRVNILSQRVVFELLLCG